MSNFVVTDPSGTTHAFPLNYATPCDGTNPPIQGMAPAMDGSGIVLDLTDNQIILKNGTKIMASGTNASGSPILPFTVQDANGNVTTVDANGNFLDFLNRQVVTFVQGPLVNFTTPLGVSMNGYPQYTLYQFQDSNGNTEAYKIDYEAIDEQSDLTPTTSGQMVVPRQITLPNTQTYKIAYNNNTTGQIASLTLPTGAKISYTYAAEYWVQNPPQPHIPPAYSGRDGVVSRTLTVGSATYNWTYSVANGGAGPVTVTGPTGTEIHTFTQPNSTSNSTFYLSPNYVESMVQYYAPGTTTNPLRTVQTNYACDPYILNTQCVNVRPISVTTTLDNGMQSQVQTDYETFAVVPANSELATATRLNPTEKREYDYGPTAPGALLRRTDYTYLHTNNQTYVNLNIVDKVASVTVYDSASNQCQGKAQACSEKIYEYDNYSHTSQPMQASSAIQHTSSFSTSYKTRGNVTASENWLNSNNTFLTSTNQYDDAGNLLSTIDPLGNQTSFDHTDSWGSTACAPSGAAKAFVTKVTNALGQAATKTYNSCTGTTASTTDVNLNSTSYTYDDMGRTLSVTDPVQTVNGTSMHGVTTYIYTDTANSVNVEKKHTINSSSSTDDFTYLDGLGREISHSHANGQTPAWDKTDICYDGEGRKIFTSYPYQASSTTPSVNCPSETGDTFTYDALSRILTVTHSDSTLITTSYTGRSTDVIDEGNGNTKASERVSQVDGLGRLISVCEVTGATQKGPGGTPAACAQDIAKTGFLTTYGYDILGNVLTATQGSMGPRSFTYDSLSRLITTTNPESGTTCYGVWQSGSCVNGYDKDGDLLVRTRPAPNQTSSTTYVTTTYQYDALNRLTSQSYSDGTTPAVDFGYDQSTVTEGSTVLPITNSIGRLSWAAPVDSTSHPLAMSAYSYDSMGRILLDAQCVASKCLNVFSFNYTYDLVGDVLTSSNGNGITYTLTYSTAPSLTTLATSWLNPTTQGNAISKLLYNGFGEAVSSSLWNGVAESWGYDARGRVQSYSAVAMSTTRYGFSGVTYSGNGSVLSATDTVNGPWSYTYDDFNRLAASSCTATCPNGTATEAFSYQYDRYGNRWGQTATAGSGPQPQLTFWGPGNVPNNRIDGESYDAAGNLLNDGNHSYTYDAENRLIKVDGGSTATYAYDADGQRVSKVAGATTLQYLFDLGGRVVTELQGGTTTTNRSEIYAGGKHIATQNVALAKTIFSHTDWLGTERARTNLGNTTIETCQGLPFGDGQVCSGSDVSPLHFTGKQRDTESNLDDFDARYYSSQFGRFMTADWDAKPAAVPYAKFGDPLTLNLYAYVENAPLNRIDADGHGVVPNPAPLNPNLTVTGTPTAPLVSADEEQYEAMVNDTNAYEAAQTAAQTTPAQAQAQNQNQQKYDPKKSGPEDPTNPGHPLSQNADVKKASDQAFMKTGNGQARSGLAEAGFAIDYKDGKLSVVNKVDSVNGDGKPNQLHITTDRNTIAILHTHGNKALATPSEGDLKSPVPNFVRSQRDLYVTVPGTTTYIQLQ